jgi:hypothetical protein
MIEYIRTVKGPCKDPAEKPTAPEVFENRNEREHPVL